MLDFEKLITNLSKSNELNEENIRTREILEILSDRDFKVTKEILDRITYRDLINFKKEVRLNSDNVIIMDMINGEYLMENVQYIKPFFDDEEEEIY